MEFMKVYILVDEKTGKQIEIGEKVKDFRGFEAVILSFTPPHKVSSSGRVYVCYDAGIKGEFFPNVFGLKIVEVKDK